jgi:hypothetical protein
LQPTYAPDVKIAGAGLGGLVPNVTATIGMHSLDVFTHCAVNNTIAIEFFDQKERASFIPPSLLGMSHDYDNLKSWLKENLVPELEPEFRKTESQCFSSNTMYSNQSMGKYFKRGLKSLYDPVPRGVMEITGMSGPAIALWTLC